MTKPQFRKIKGSDLAHGEIYSLISSIDVFETEPISTFIIPTIGRDTLARAIDSCQDNPVLIGHDAQRRGEAIIRNELIQQANTEWVSFLDDDDTVTEDYMDRLREEIEKNPDADVIHFREYFLRGQLLPNWPKVEWGNVGICFSVKKSVAQDYPFEQQKHEDFHFLKKLDDAGKKIVFSQYITYRARH